MEGEEHQPQLPSHPRPRHRKLPPLGEGGAQDGGRLHSGAGRRAVHHQGGPRGRRHPPPWGLHLRVGGVQLQPRQRHPVVRQREERDGRVRRLQALERLHASPAHRKRRGQALEDPLSQGDISHGAPLQLVLRPQPVLVMQHVSALLQEV